MQNKDVQCNYVYFYICGARSNHIKGRLLGVIFIAGSFLCGRGSKNVPSIN